jgi:hypothetical protein
MTLEGIRALVRELRRRWKWSGAMGRTTKKFVHYQEEGKRQREAEELEAFLQKQEHTLEIHLGSHAREWAAYTQADVDEIYNELRIAEYVHSWHPRHLCCCPIKYTKGYYHSPTILPRERVRGDKYLYYHEKRGPHYFVDV